MKGRTTSRWPVMPLPPERSESGPPGRRQRAIPYGRPVAVGLTLALLAGIAVVAFLVLPRAGDKAAAGPAYSTPAELPQLAPDAKSGNPLQERRSEEETAINLAASRYAEDRAPRTGAMEVIHPVILGAPRPVVMLMGPASAPVEFRLSVVAREFPEHFLIAADGSVEIKHPVRVAGGATLVVDASSTPAVALESGAAGNASIVGTGGNLIFRGTAQHRLTITSRDPATRQADTDTSDGRAYLATRGAAMNFSHVDVTDLGYLIGKLSGVSWMPYEARNAMPTGGAVDTLFARNHFGAYSSNGQGLRFERAQFRDNAVYGFDPHTNTNDTVVSDSVATGNGTHGIIFSKGCHRNVIRNSEASGNGVNGFMIDDGNPDLGPLEGSDGNRLEGLTANGNGQAGITIEGGTGNVISDVSPSGNQYGIWVRNGATATSIQGAEVTATEHAGLRLGAGTSATTVTASSVNGAAIGAAIADASGTAMTDVAITASAHGLRITGEESLPAQFTDVTITGSGASAVEIDGRSGELEGVNTAGWQEAPPSSLKAAIMGRMLHPMTMLVWAVLLVPPIVAWLPGRIRRIRRARAQARSA